MIDILLHAYAAAFLIFWGCKTTTSGSNILIEFAMYLLFKASAVAVGLSFAFSLYAQYKGWPV